MDIKVIYKKIEVHSIILKEHEKLFGNAPPTEKWVAITSVFDGDITVLNVRSEEVKND